MAPSVHPRPMCYRCVKPVSHCVCALLPRVENQTPVVILQHPRERHHPLGTVRMARLALQQVEVRECGPRDTEAMARATAAWPAGAALLFPGPQARELGELPPPERPRALVVLDGTWHQAKTLYRASKALQALPHVALTPPRPSQYQIRREPQRNYVSTLEAIVHALQILEPETDNLNALEEAFLRMIAHHVHPANSRQPRPRKARAPKPLPLPQALREPLQNLVVGYAEMATCPTDPSQRAALVWSAVKPATGETFWQALRTPFQVSPAHLAHMGLTGQHLAQAIAPEELARTWERFAHGHRALVVWNASSLNRVSGLEQVLLKETYCNVIHGASGHLEDVVRREGLTPPAVAVPGRAADRLSRAWAVLAHLRRLDDANRSSAYRRAS